MSEKASAIGVAIKNRRLALDMTLQDVADEVGVSKSTVTKWERGIIGSIGSDKIIRLAAALKMTAAELVSGGNGSNCFRSDETVRIPIIGRVAAGLGCYAEEDVEGYEYASKSLIHSGNEYVYLRVQGESMAPLILEGDLVLIRCQDYVNSGSYAAVIIDNEDGVVKKIRYGSKWIELISENPYYPVRRFENSETERIRIFGQVIESKHLFA